MYTNLDLCLISCYICLSYLAFWVKKFIKVMKLITDLIRTKRIQLWNPVDIRFDQSNQPRAIQLIIDTFFFFFFFFCRYWSCFLAVKTSIVELLAKDQWVLFPDNPAMPVSAVAPLIKMQAPLSFLRYRLKSQIFAVQSIAGNLYLKFL